MRSAGGISFGIGATDISSAAIGDDIDAAEDGEEDAANDLEGLWVASERCGPAT